MSFNLFWSPNKFSLLVLFLFLALQIACGSNDRTLEQARIEIRAVELAETMVAQTSQAQPSATQTPVPTDTMIPSPTFTITPTATATLTDTPTPTITPTSPPLQISEKMILAYYIAADTGGPVACGDSVIGVHFGVEYTGDVLLDVKWAMTSLFTNHAHTVLGLANPIGLSDLKVESVVLNNKTINVNITGRLSREDVGCNKARILAQILATSRGAAPGFSVNVLYNGIGIHDFLTDG